jgi:hypothetical protein
MILQISVIAHSCEAYLYQGMSFLDNRFEQSPTGTRPQIQFDLAV